MPRVPELYEIDEDGRIHRQADQGQPDIIGKIVTERGLARSQFAPFDTLERDLVRVAVAVLNVDRRSLRQPPGVRDEEREAIRQRSLALRIPVENPERWSRAAPILADVLRFMTDDHWSFEFARSNYTPQQQLPLFSEPIEDGAELLLFSGGLDSVAGLWARHRMSPRQFIALTVYGDHVKLASRTAAIETLRQLGAMVDLVRFVHHLRKQTRPESNNQEPAHQRRPKEEYSQRTRGFTFFSIGAAMASNLRLESVHTYEAGIGALNVPANDAQIGAQNTRAMHPWTLHLLEQLLQEVLDRPPRLDGPFLFHTKGEVCRLAAPELSHLAGIAMSCDEGEGHKRNRMDHCGVCTSCLLRRAALYDALGTNDPTVYRDHATRTHGDYDVKAFATQAIRFVELSGSYRRLLELDPDLRKAVQYHVRRGMPQGRAEELLRDLFARQSIEAIRFIESKQYPKIPLPHNLAEARR